MKNKSICVNKSKIVFLFLILIIESDIDVYMYAFLDILKVPVLYLSTEHLNTTNQI